jgi:hypothetical protein
LLTGEDLFHGLALERGCRPETEVRRASPETSTLSRAAIRCQRRWRWQGPECPDGPVRPTT